MPERDLTCAFYNEQAGDWESLKCDNEVATDEHITCCTDHLTRFALVPVEYLEVVREVQKLEEKQIEAEPAKIELTDQGRGINVKYLIGCVCAFFTLVGTLFCLGKQIFAFKTEKKRYEQLIRDNQNSSGENAMPTERALITATDEHKTASPNKVVSTDMPALQTQQSDEDEDCS